MGQISGKNAKYLKTEFLLSRIMTIMEPFLGFMDIIPGQPVSESSVAYRYYDTSASTDTKKKTPRKRTASADWTYVTVSEMTAGTAILNKEGFAIRLDEDALKSEIGVSEISRAINRVGYWLVQDMNTRFGTALTGGATTPTWTPTATWDDATATPVLDLIKFRQEMKREGYPYQMTDIFIHNDNRDELEQYLANVDVADGKQKYVYGMPSQDTIRVPVVGCDIHGMLSGITEGYVLGLDRNNPAATVFYQNDSSYSTPKVRYETKTPDGTKTFKTVDNFGLNTYQYKEDDTHDVVVQFWLDNVAVVMEAYAALYDSGI